MLDNLATHRNKQAAATLKAHGCWFLFLPPYSPDLNPIEQAFSRLTSGAWAHEPSQRSSTLSAKSATSMILSSAGTTSGLPDMPQINLEML
ncbi:transposase [uncultured Roseovarius sp.]|uniref:transposase n=1 Tax=uncultured Roseovarius sp. TaxID=293344 RepID=UPI00342CF5BF